MALEMISMVLPKRPLPPLLPSPPVAFVMVALSMESLKSLLLPSPRMPLPPVPLVEVPPVAFVMVDFSMVSLPSL